MSGGKKMHSCDLATLTHQRTKGGLGAMARVFQCLQGVFTRPGQLQTHRAANASHCIGHHDFPPDRTHDMTADELRLVYHARYVDCDHKVWSCPILAARDRENTMDRDQERKRHHAYHAEVRCQELRERNLHTTRPPGEGQTHRNAYKEARPNAEHAQTRDAEMRKPRPSHPDDGLWCNPPSPGHYSDSGEIVHEREHDFEELTQEQGTCRTNTDLHQGHTPEWERSRSKTRSRSRRRTRSRSRSRSRSKTRRRNHSRGSNRGHATKRHRSRSASRRRSRSSHTSIFIVDARSTQSPVKRHTDRTAGTRHERNRRSGGKTEQRDYRGHITDERSIHRATPGDSRSRGGDNDSRGRSNRGETKSQGRERERQRERVREQDRTRKRERE
jgi:hypothetical protein